MSCRSLILSLILPLALSVSARAQYPAFGQKSLSSLEGVTVRIGGLSQEQRGKELSHKIETEVELALRKAGVEVRDKQSPPFLYVETGTHSRGMEGGFEVASFTCTVYVLREVELTGAGETMVAMTYRPSPVMGITSKDNLSTRIVEGAKTLANEFANDWLATH